jgi:hypothetical protein
VFSPVVDSVAEMVGTCIHVSQEDYVSSYVVASVTEMMGTCIMFSQEDYVSSYVVDSVTEMMGTCILFTQEDYVSSYVPESVTDDGDLHSVQPGGLCVQPGGLCVHLRGGQSHSRDNWDLQLLLFPPLSFLPLQPVLGSWVWTVSCKNKFFVPTHAALPCLDIGCRGGVERLPEPLLSYVSSSHLEIIYQGLVGTIILHNGPGGWESRSLLLLLNAKDDLLTLLLAVYVVVDRFDS